MAAAQPQQAVGSNQNVALHVGRNAADLAHRFTAGTSRVSRSRATNAGLRKRKTVSPQSPPSPNQESAINSRTGKVAFGPWLGPYESHNDTVPTGPLFMDRDGNTYASLSSVLNAMPKADAEPQLPEAKSPAAAATQQLYAMVNKVMLKQAVSQSRRPAQYQRRGKPVENFRGRCGSTMGRAINQPRKC
ncbi:hypothetical protein GPECTOR_34g708 [Gonium pectorale]|uniref:Uncharacterized protein n=1 Tax=Gonium pectorale TaxID=33097 RepID=A0A150GCI7_GONPE|nr:hypothetical protein GPECTOR_34g708 [Gonium pectorale]|eukprot:KXZ47549.1 hypothetical protein GPECTOR_34g708 [Gonium pectorale]